MNCNSGEPLENGIIHVVLAFCCYFFISIIYNDEFARMNKRQPLLSVCIRRLPSKNHRIVSNSKRVVLRCFATVCWIIIWWCLCDSTVAVAKRVKINVWKENHRVEHHTMQNNNNGKQTNETNPELHQRDTPNEIAKWSTVCVCAQCPFP